MKKFLINTGVFLTSISLFAFTAHAQGVPDVNTGITTLAGLIDAFTKNIVKSLGTMFLALGVVAFFYGVVQYIWGVRQGETAKITAGNKFMGVGLLALFVMFSVYGIIKLGQGILFGSANVNKIDIPEINFVKGTGNATTNTNGGGLNGAGAQMTCPNGVDKVPASLGIGACPGGSGTGGSNGGVNGSDGYLCPDGKTKYFNQSDAKFCPSGTSGGGTKKANGYSCTDSSECTSGFCDPVDDTCTAKGQGSLKPNGYSCTNGSQCSSGFCDPADDTCSNLPVSGGGVGDCGSGEKNECETDSDCQDGQKCFAKYHCLDSPTVCKTVIQ